MMLDLKCVKLEDKADFAKPFELTMVSYRAVPITNSTSITGYFLRAILIENTVVVGLLKCVCHTPIGIVAGLNTVLNVIKSERV